MKHLLLPFLLLASSAFAADDDDFSEFLFENAKICGEPFADPIWVPVLDQCTIQCDPLKEYCVESEELKQQCKPYPEECQKLLAQRKSIRTKEEHFVHGVTSEQDSRSSTAATKPVPTKATTPPPTPPPTLIANTPEVTTRAPAVQVAPAAHHTPSPFGDPEVILRRDGPRVAPPTQRAQWAPHQVGASAQVNHAPQFPAPPPPPPPVQQGFQQAQQVQQWRQPVATPQSAFEQGNAGWQAAQRWQPQTQQAQQAQQGWQQAQQNWQRASQQPQQWQQTVQRTQQWQQPSNWRPQQVQNTVDDFRRRFGW